MISPRIERPIAPADLVKALSRHRRKALAWSLLVAGMSLVALIIWPRTYESDAKLFLRLGRESIAVDPSATTGATIQVQESRENQLNSARDMLKSRALLERVVETIGVEMILKGSPKPSQTEVAEKTSTFGSTLSALVSSIKSISSLTDVSSEEKAVNKLSKSIGVSLAKNSSVINVHCKAKNAKLARDILQSFLDAYREQHLSANRTAGSLRFFETQASQSKQELDTAVAELRDAKNAFGLISISTEQQAVQSQLTQLEENLMAAKAALASSEASSASLRKSLESTPETLTTQQTTGFANAAADHMQHEFFKLLISVNEQQVKLGENHPLVKIARDHARELEQVLDKQPADRAQTTIGINLSRQSLELDLQREEALVASTLAKVDLLTSQYASFQQRLEALNQHEVRINDLERRVSIAESKYRSYADHLEQARIGDALEASRISNLNIVQPPSLVEKPVNPKPLVIFGLAFVAIIAGSLVLVFGSEYLERERWETDHGRTRPHYDRQESWTRAPLLEPAFAERCTQAPQKG
jgi:polysaccharide biosynthesis protein PslE